MCAEIGASLRHTAIAASFAAAVWLSAGVAPAHADELGDTIKSNIETAIAGLPANQVAAIRNVLNGTTDGATMLSQLNGLTGLLPTVAMSLGTGLGTASKALATSNPTGAAQIQTAVANNSNPMVSVTFASASFTASGNTNSGGSFGNATNVGAGSVFRQLSNSVLNRANTVAKAMQIGPYGT